MQVNDVNVERCYHRDAVQALKDSGVSARLVCTLNNWYLLLMLMQSTRINRISKIGRYFRVYKKCVKSATVAK